MTQQWERDDTAQREVADLEVAGSRLLLHRLRLTSALGAPNPIAEVLI